MEKKRVRGLGTHLTFTLVDCDIDRLNNYDMLMGLSKNLPYRIGMSLIDVPNNPMIYSCYSPKNPDNWGYSVTLILHESHIAMHCWPVEGTLDCDIFSCYPFDFKKPLKIISTFFKGKPVNVNVIERGDNGEYFEI